MKKILSTKYETILKFKNQRSKIKMTTQNAKL